MPRPLGTALFADHAQVHSRQSGRHSLAVVLQRISRLDGLGHLEAVTVGDLQRRVAVRLGLSAKRRPVIKHGGRNGVSILGRPYPLGLSGLPVDGAEFRPLPGHRVLRVVVAWGVTRLSAGGDELLQQGQAVLAKPDGTARFCRDEPEAVTIVGCGRIPLLVDRLDGTSRLLVTAIEADRLVALLLVLSLGLLPPQLERLEIEDPARHLLHESASDPGSLGRFQSAICLAVELLLGQAERRRARADLNRWPTLHLPPLADICGRRLLAIPVEEQVQGLRAELGGPDPAIGLVRSLPGVLEALEEVGQQRIRTLQ